MIVAKRRVVRCSTECHHSGRPYVVRIDEGARTVSVKLKGLRKWFRIPIRQLYVVGGYNEAAAIRVEKLRRKKERREEKKRQGLL